MDDSKSGKGDPAKIIQTDGLPDARALGDSVPKETGNGGAGDLKGATKNGVTTDNVVPIKKKRRRPRRKKKNPAVPVESKPVDVLPVPPLYQVEDKGEQNISYEPYAFDDIGPVEPSTEPTSMENVQKAPDNVTPFTEEIGDESLVNESNQYNEPIENYVEPDVVEAEVLDRRDHELEKISAKERDYEPVESRDEDEMNVKEKPTSKVKEEMTESPNELKTMADIKKLLNEGPEGNTNEKGENVFANVILKVWPFIAGIFSFGNLLKVVVIGGVIWGVYFIISSGFFNFSFGGKTFEAEISGNSGVILDEGKSLPTDLGVYFGELKEPTEKRETGITAALYFGELVDENSVGFNQYIDYVQNLEELFNLYSTDVYALLDKGPKRDEVLYAYLDDLKKSRDKSLKMLSAINLNIDEMRTSFSSLSPEKDKFERDYFASLRAFQAAKSDILLKSFVDVSQKQTALKARIFALETLAGYYDTALYNVGRRIEAVEKNTDALIKGVRVTDVPGSGIDLIIKSE